MGLWSSRCGGDVDRLWCSCFREEEAATGEEGVFVFVGGGREVLRGAGMEVVVWLVLALGVEVAVGRLLLLLLILLPFGNGS